ncbi:MAG TPA: sigma-70 family RNA polymerase sigma factor [Thermoanaerobaculia bacterium]|nr:sigma-70 family RNA polymerase sigma factor [Thermoanaerobaculia bacterium]
MSETSDDHLMRRLAAGEIEALGPLVERYKDPMTNYLTRLTGNKERGEELAQETFLRLLRAAPGYRSEGRFSALLYRIATNLARSEARSLRRFRLRFERFAGEMKGNGYESFSGPEDTLLRQEARDCVSRALSTLPMRYRVPLTLYAIEGWSYLEIAGFLALREGTVKSRIARGRQRLRAALVPYWQGEEEQ